MTINLTMPIGHELKPKITVIGVGGAGCNAVNNMITSHLEGVEFVVANTDAQAIANCLTDRKVQLGASITHGLGAGARPEVGRASAEEAIDDILDQLQGSHMVFITAGMGGGTGTGAAPVIARAVREQGILTVGVVTKPFQFEGAPRMRLAEQGLAELQEFVDTLIVVPNQNLFRLANEKTTFAEAFKLADQVLHMGVRGVTDLMMMPGLINLDFADVRTVMSEMGKAMMGTGEAEGERRAIEAAEAAISNPLLDEVSMRGAQAVLVNITGGMDISLFEVDAAVNRIREELEENTNIIFGSTFDESMQGRMRVSVVATGIDAAVRNAAEAEAVAAEPEPAPASEPERPGQPTPIFRFQAQSHSAGEPPRSRGAEGGYAAETSRPQAPHEQQPMRPQLRQPSMPQPPADGHGAGPVAMPNFIPRQSRSHGAPQPQHGDRGLSIFERMKGFAFARPGGAEGEHRPTGGERRPVQDKRDQVVRADFDEVDDLPPVFRTEKVDS